MFKTAKLAALLLAEADGIPVTISERDAPAAVRLALALHNPSTAIAKAAEYARLHTSRFLDGIENPQEAAFMRGMRLVFGDKEAAVMNDKSRAALGEEIAAEHRRLVLAAQIEHLRGLPEPTFSFLSEPEIAEVKRVAAVMDGSAVRGEVLADMTNVRGIARETVTAVIQAFRDHARAAQTAEGLQALLENQFSPAHIDSERPKMREAAIEARVAAELAVHAEQQQLEADKRAVAEREDQVKQKRRDAQQSSRRVIEDEAARMIQA